MDRKQAEKIIGEALELIRLVCEAYDPEYGHCSMYVTPISKGATILKGDGEESEYALHFYETEVDDE